VLRTAQNSKTCHPELDSGSVFSKVKKKAQPTLVYCYIPE